MLALISVPHREAALGRMCAGELNRWALGCWELELESYVLTWQAPEGGAEVPLGVRAGLDESLWAGVCPRLLGVSQPM